MPSTDFVTWRNTFNGFHWKSKTLRELTDLARSGEYSYLACPDGVFALTDSGLVKIDASENDLEIGITVETSDEGVRTCTPERARSVWVVLTLTFEYNDEYYYSNDTYDDVEAVKNSYDEARAFVVDSMIPNNRVDNPFELVNDTRHIYQFEDLILMPWPQWQDWLKDRDIPPPTCGSDDEVRNGPRVESLYAWWENNKDLFWDRVKARQALEFVDNGLYEIVEQEVG